MIFFNLFSFLFVISTTHLFGNALFTEGLVSDALAKLGMFTYQVAIMGRKNSTNEKTLQCGGGIISPTKILAAAQCFITDDGFHKEFTFSIIANAVNTRNGEGIEVDIKLIYLVSADSFYYNDISVSELEHDLYALSNLQLQILEIPDYHAWFNYEEGVVAGYGFTWSESELDLDTWTEYRINGDTDGKLRYSKVLAKVNRDCVNRTTHDPLLMLCGIMPYDANGPRGICELDTGSPLVIGNKVFGIATSGNARCKDVDFGGAYTGAQFFMNFINSILEDSPLATTIIYPNRPHVLN